MSRRDKTFRELVECDVDAAGHSPVSMKDGISQIVGDFELLANGDLICGGKTFRDMEAVSAGHDLMPAVRKPGYGKPLSIGEGNTPTVYRFVHKAWHRLTEGGPLLGKSTFFSSTVVYGPLLARDGNKSLELDGGEHRLGGRKDAELVTLFADGRVKVFDLEFFPDGEIDVSSPQAELARLQDSPYLAVRVPDVSQNYLLEYPHALAAVTTWLMYADGSWHPQEASHGLGVNTPRFLRLLGKLTGTVLYGPP